ncbi:MAG: type II toxin-antitoxin system RelB/DinJ family antitoxin [Chloroflexi bacterium]|nr:type II toxin-antitoxin system RelB/DinJ family antitoxin [Chloroflexota bacterium]
MNKTANVSIRVKPEIKNNAEDVFNKLGITPTDAITMFYRQVDIRQGIPFPVEIPNGETMKTINDAWAGINTQKVNSAEELRAEIESG